jgi:protein-S-isoprenylcysteine O-methyltransferase Ste14
LPLPLAVAILAIPPGQTAAGFGTVLCGGAVTAFGEAVRLWGVYHIGAISRTRSDRLGPLVTTGPFAYVRNPLYVGNLALWMGFALTARLVWLAPIVLIVLGGEYHAIVRWEERLLASRLGEAYREYVREVPRWIPAVNRGGRSGSNLSMSSGSVSSASSIPPARSVSSAPSPASVSSAFSWRATLFSERGTLMALAAGYALLWLKARF